MTESLVTREDIPLKKGKTTKKWYTCHDDHFTGSGYVNIAFGTLTVIITFALIIQIYYGDYQVVPHGSVASDNLECSEIGTSILKKGGNAVDAAIASAFCLSVALPHLTSLDAEGQMIVYNHKAKNPPLVINFSHASVASKNLPTLVIGLAYAHKRFGHLPWELLVYPSSLLARRGILVSKMLVQAVTSSKAEDLYGRLEPGQLLVQEDLAVTLEHIANISEPVLYSYVHDLNETVLTDVIKPSKFENFNVYTPQKNSVGSYLTGILKEVESVNFTSADINKPEYIFNIAQIIQRVYEKTNINDVFHEGTVSNIAVMDTADSYVSLVTGMYQLFGSREKTSDGYVEDIKNEKTMCSRMPVLITDGRYVCGRRIVFGANNVATALQIIVSLLIGNKNGAESIVAPRFHVIGNGTIGIEDSHLPYFSDDILKRLETLTLKLYLVPEPYESSNIVEKYKDTLSSQSDGRGGGIASRY